MQSNWNLRALCGWYATAAALSLSFLWQPSRVFWDTIDRHVAFALNGIVHTNHAQQMIWAFANLRVFDYIAAAVMLALIVHYAVSGTNAERAIRVVRMIATCIMLVALVAFTREFLFQDITRDSPSLILKPFTMLSEQTPLDPKDYSSQSFPGDHATVLATFTLLLWHFAGRRYGLASTALAILFVLPRLISGAHWLSDVLIGGVVTALVAVPVMIFTPIEHYVLTSLLRMAPRRAYPPPALARNDSRAERHR